MRSGFFCYAWFLAVTALLWSSEGAAGVTETSVTLDNGLLVLVRERSNRPLVAVDVYYRAGAAADPDSLAGLAHLTEHLLVVGDGVATAGSPRRRLALLTLSNGAFTAPDVMAFEAECLPIFLPEVLTVEAERMGGVRCDPSEFAREHSVVLEELAFRTGDRDASTVVAAFRAAFPGHPYGRAVGGADSTVSRITPADLDSFTARTLHPANAALVIEGPVDTATALEQVRRHLGGIPAGAAQPPLPPLPRAASRQVVLDNREHEGHRITAAVRVPVRSARDLVLVELAVAHLRERFYSLTLTLIPGEAVLQYSWFGSYYRPEARFGVMTRRFDPDQDVQWSLQWSWQRIREAVAELVDPEERERLQEWLAGAAERRQGRLLPRSTAATALLAGSPLPDTEAYDALLSGIELADLHDFLARHLVVDATSIAVSHGRDSERVAFRAMKGRVARHTVATDDPLAGLAAAEIEPVLRAYGESGLLRLEIVELASGIPVVVSHIPDESDWVLRGWRYFGGIKEARRGKRPGICRLWVRSVAWDPTYQGEDRPPRRWPHDAWFDLDPAGQLHFGADGTAAEPEEIAASLAERLETDRFNLTVWARTLNWGEAAFPSLARNASGRARAWRLARVLGEDHPLVGASLPDTRTPEDIKYKDLQKLHRHAARPTGQTTLLAVGGLSAEQVTAALAPSFGRRDRWEVFRPDPPPPGPTAIEGTVITAIRETDVILSLSFPALVLDPDWPEPGLSLLLGRELLNLALDSRLRQQEGWTYSVYFDLLVASGWIVPQLHVTCQPGQAPAVLKVIRAELARLDKVAADSDLVALARLRLVSRLLRSAGNAKRLDAWLRPVTAQESVPADPVQAVLSLKAVALAELLPRLAPADRFAFSATGAIFEEDLDQFEF